MKHTHCQTAQRSAPGRRPTLHKRLFVWLFGSLLLCAAGTAGTVHLLNRFADSGDKPDRERMQQFVANRFGRVWDDEAERMALVRDVHATFGAAVFVRDRAGRVLSSDGQCTHSWWTVPVQRQALPLGSVEFCGEHPRAAPVRIGVAVMATLLILWLASGRLAKRLLKPVLSVITTARAIGSGNYKARAVIGHHPDANAHELATAINEMAEKIEKQLGEQRELMAAVSHEIRSPLSRMRLLLELARSAKTPQASESRLAELEQEISEIDALVGDLLAQARLDFSALRRSSINVNDMALSILSKRGLSPTLLEASGTVMLDADATLVQRAIVNLVQNAEQHGGGLTRLTLSAASGATTVAAEDAGKGFSPEAIAQLFEPFSSDGTNGSLGLGLALVKRIAEAHGGEAFAENLPQGGARVGVRWRTHSTV